MADPVRLSDIVATDWSPQLDAIGQVVEDLDDINQCIRVILTTQKGSREHEPLFGCDFIRIMDRPVNQAIPFIVREAVDAITTWEPRVSVTSIAPVIDNEHVTLLVEWTLKDFSTTAGQTEVTL